MSNSSPVAPCQSKRFPIKPWKPCSERLLAQSSPGHGSSSSGSPGRLGHEGSRPTLRSPSLHRTTRCPWAPRSSTTTAASLERRCSRHTGCGKAVQRDQRSVAGWGRGFDLRHPVASTRSNAIEATGVYDLVHPGSECESRGKSAST